MAPSHRPPVEAGPDDPADRDALARHAAALADAVDEALPRWVEAAVRDRHQALAGGPPPPEFRAAARAAGGEAAADVGARVRTLLERDVDDQRTGPLALLREAVRYPTEVLAAAGVPPADRDDGARRIHPADTYDLAPGAFADVDPSLHEPGIVWGAAKAHVVMARRRREGLR